ncbi:hypothetical protein K1719_011257 [Acacia pycnantha]|nr:hypothetical protein K1719_011257 [Acacia pycnantha]
MNKEWMWKPMGRRIRRVKIMVRYRSYGGRYNIPEGQRAAEDMHSSENCEFTPDSIMGSNKWKTLNTNGKENLHPGGAFVKTGMGKHPVGMSEEEEDPIESVATTSKGFVAVLKDTKFRYKVDVAVILEPQISGVLATKTIKSWGFKFSEKVEAVGFSSGIWILWNLDDLCVDVLVKEDQFIHCRLTLNGKGMLFTTMYANPNEQRRQRLWNSLQDLAGEIAEPPWLLAGDFNEIKSPLEQQGGGRVNEIRCRKFSEWIQTCGLLDMEANDHFFTWKGPKWEGLDRVYKRLDRCLCNVNWLEVFVNAEVRVVPRVGSDHHPMLVKSCADLSFAGRRNFKYEMMWKMHENFVDFMRSSWKANEDTHVMLNLLQRDLKVWNREVFGRIEYRKRRILNRLNGIQQSVSRRSGQGKGITAVVADPQEYEELCKP